MRSRLILASLAIVAAFIAAPAAGALDVKQTTDILAQLAPNLGCENGQVTEASFPDPTNPLLTESVSILCPGGLSLDTHYGTDCPGDSNSKWQGPILKPNAFQYDTTNPFAFSQATVVSAWNGANTVWDNAVVASLFGGSTIGGSAANVGKGDGINQAGFKAMSGSLRNAIAVEYAWTNSAKNIIETDSGYNTNYPYSTTGDPNSYDLQSIAAQEFGHGYALGHSDTSSASACLTMYPYGTLGATWGRTLGDGDLASIHAQYGP